MTAEENVDKNEQKKGNSSHVQHTQGIIYIIERKAPKTIFTTHLALMINYTRLMSSQTTLVRETASIGKRRERATQRPKKKKFVHTPNKLEKRYRQKKY